MALGLVCVLAAAIIGCSERVPLSGERSPRDIVQGAIGSSARALVAPSEYRAGRLTQVMADAWITRVENDYRQWYASPMLDQKLEGIRNVVEASEAGSYPIMTEFDGFSMFIPAARIHDNEATVQEATVSYLIHYAPESSARLEVKYSAMYSFTLHRTASGWKITDESCTDSGG